MSKPKDRSNGQFPMHSSCDEYICPCHEDLQRLIGILNSTKAGQLIIEEQFKPKVKEELPEVVHCCACLTVMDRSEVTTRHGDNLCEDCAIAED